MIGIRYAIKYYNLLCVEGMGNKKEGKAMNEKEARDGLSVIHRIESIKKTFDEISLKDLSDIRRILSQYIPVTEAQSKK